MKKLNRIAALHLAKGALEAITKGAEVEVGHHDLSNGQLVFTFPAFAAVDRGDGTKGEGFNEAKPDEPAKLDLSIDAVLLFNERHAGLTGPKSLAAWDGCIRDAQRGMAGTIPFEAIEALVNVAKELPAVKFEPTKTQAKRTGANEVVIEDRRLPKTAVA